MPVKILAPNTQRFDREPLYAIKRSSRGLVGSDLSEFIKRAGHSLADQVRRLDVHPGERLIHLIALGTTEKTGANRNADGFREAACDKYHHTFVKYARFYRDHLNKNTEKSYGGVKLSTLNRPMGRVELIAGLNGTKEAADHNKGLIADREMEKIAAGKQIPVSMACRVPEDYCSSCNHAAKHRDFYCDEDTCNRGGLKHNLGKVAADGHVLHADNRDPCFFDISHVWRPADRIAYVLGEYEKSAASGHVKSGAAMAEEFGISENFSSLAAFGRAAPQMKLALALSTLEEGVTAGRTNDDLAFAPSVRDARDFCEFSKTAADKIAFAAALAERRICLPVAAFLSLHLNQTLEKVGYLAEGVARNLPGVYSRLVADSNLEDVCAGNPYTTTGAAPTQKMREFAHKVAADYSWEDSPRRTRMVLASLRGAATPAVTEFEKTAASSDVERLTSAYALYKLAFLAHWEPILETSPMLKLAIRQNYLNNPLA